jgi:hypothetical protein
MERSSAVSEEILGSDGKAFLEDRERMVKVKKYANHPKNPEKRKFVNIFLSVASK